MKMTIIRNALIVLGIYWLSMWVVVPIASICLKITAGMTYSSGAGMFLSSVIPISLVALGAGILCVYTIEGDSRKYWLVALALLYVIFGFFSWHWVQPPSMLDRVWQFVRSIVPAIVCFLAGYIAMNRPKSKNK
jgi:hypothetical protein